MTSYLESVKKQFVYYNGLGDSTFEKLSEQDIHWQHNANSNSIAIITHHIAGNMLSRWTNFLSEDGEKNWRQRDKEFEEVIKNKAELLAKWEEGWQCLFNAIDPLTSSDLEKIIYIRNQGHTVVEAINRQLAHYAYHIGQLVYLAKMIKGNAWVSLSIPKNASDAYNDEKFKKPKQRTHFTDDI